MQKNLQKLDYTDGFHPEVRGSKRLDSSGRKLAGEIESHITVFDNKFNPKEFQRILADHNKAVQELKELKPVKEQFELSFIVGYTGKKGQSNSKPSYTIKNAKDFEVGKFDELVQLGQRALSTSEPSLKKLSQPVAEDPRASLYKRERGYISPTQISYNQGTYQ